MPESGVIMKKISIAIDGPSGAGKSTIAKIIAKDFGFTYVDTGAIYRAVGLYIFRSGLNPKSASDVSEVLPEIKIEILHNNGVQRIFLNGEDVSEEIRKHHISQYASDVSAIPEVREFLLEMQRMFAENGNVIMDGRDIGTVVLPNARVKIFLTASNEDRARRRYEELVSKGQDVSFEKVLADMKIRDEQDSNRKTAPLFAAPDAIKVDTTGNTLDESVRVIKNIITVRLSFDDCI